MIIIWSWTSTLWPLCHEFRWFLDCLNYSSCLCFRLALSCHVDSFDLTKSIIYGLIQTRECALNWFIMESVHEHLLDICHLRNLGACNYLGGKHIPYVQMILNWCEKWHNTQMQCILTHIPLEFFSWTCVGLNLWGRCATVALLPQIAKLLKKHKIMVSRLWIDLNRYVAHLLNEGNILSFGDDLNGGSIKKSTPISFLNYYPSRPLLTFLL